MKIHRLLPAIALTALLIITGGELRGMDKPLRTVWVKVVGDQHYSRQGGWEKKARRELDEVSDLLAEHLGIRLEITSYETWYHEREKDLKKLTAQLIDEVDPGPADVVVGFTLRSGSRKMKALRNDGVSLAFRGMMLKVYQGAPDNNYFLPIVILHEMTHLFGGVHVEEGSLMSPQMERGIRLALDSINSQIIDITREIDFDKGYSSLGRSDLIKLAGLYESAVADGNREIPTFLELGQMYMTLEQYGPAMRAYRQLLDVNRSMDYAWLHLGDCFYKQNQSDSAIGIYEAALDFIEDKGRFYHRLAVLYYNKNEYRKSYTYAQMANKHDYPVSKDLWSRLRKIKADLKL